jgi:hypothetical protein
VKSDGNTFVVALQFSKKGMRAWTNGRYVLLNRFRHATDEMVEGADMNAAYSVFDPAGQLLGGCYHKRGARESTCNTAVRKREG